MDWGLALPNVLTLSRIPLAAAIWVAPAWAPWTLSIIALAGVSDVLDGWLVRRRRRRLASHHDAGAWAAGTGQGAFLDGLCDKIFVVSVLLAVAVAIAPPIHLVLLIAARELLTAGFAVAWKVLPSSWREAHDFTAGLPGKVATVAQFGAIILAILGLPLFEPVAWVAGALGVAAVAYYFVRTVRSARLQRARS